MRNRGYLANLEAGLLADDNTEVTPVVDGESVLEEISNGCEDIIPDGYTEIDGEMTVTENLVDAIEEEEIIMEEVEVPMAESGAESDFNANTIKLLAASHRRLNHMMGVDEKRGAPVSALESDVYGGYKKAFMAGLEAKEGFLKNLKAKAGAAFKAILDTIRKWIQKAVIFFNGAEKSAGKLDDVLSKKDKLKDEKDKLQESDKKALADKFGAWIALGGKVSTYPTYAKSLEQPAVPSAEKKIPLRDAGIGAMPSAVVKALALDTRDQFSILNLSGKVGKFLILKQNLKSNGGDNRVNYVDLALDAKEISGIEVQSFKATITDKEITDTEVPSIKELTDFAATTYALAKKLKSVANENYTAAESFSKAMKDIKEGEEAKGAALDRVSKIATRAALENVAAYMTAMKTMLWFSSSFAKRYEDKK